MYGIAEQEDCSAAAIRGGHWAGGSSRPPFREDALWGSATCHDTSIILYPRRLSSAPLREFLAELMGTCAERDGRGRLPRGPPARVRTWRPLCLCAKCIAPQMKGQARCHRTVLLPEGAQLVAGGFSRRTRAPEIEKSRRDGRHLGRDASVKASAVPSGLGRLCAALRRLKPPATHASPFGTANDSCARDREEAAGHPRQSLRDCEPVPLSVGHCTRSCSHRERSWLPAASAAGLVRQR